MAKVAIYYKQDKKETTEQAVLLVNKLIQSLETHHTIKGVFMDLYDSSDELMELLNLPLQEIDYIYLNKPIDNEFDNLLLNQLSRTEQFEIILFD